MFTNEEAQELITLIYGDKPGKEIKPEDIEAHFTLYMSAKDIKTVGQQKVLMNQDLAAAKEQYMKDMRDHSPFTVKGGIMTRQKTIDAEIEKRKQWHSDLIKDAAKNHYYYSNTKAWFMGSSDKSGLKKMKDTEYLQKNMFTEDAQIVYAQSLYFKNKLPNYVEQDPDYAAPQKGTPLDHAKKFYHMIELFYRPISVLADPNPDPNPNPNPEHKMNHYCLAKLHFDEIAKEIGNVKTADLIERDEIHTNKKKLNYLEKLNEEFENRSVYAPQGVSTLTPNECKTVMDKGLDNPKAYDYELYTKALFGMKSAMPSLDIEKRLEVVEEKQLSDKARVKFFNDMHELSTSRLDNTMLVAIRVDAKKAESLRCNRGQEYTSSISDVVKSLDVNSRTTEEAKKLAKKDIVTGAALFMQYTRDIREEEAPYLKHSEIKKVLGDKPDHMMQYKVRIPSEGVMEYTDLRSAFNKIAEKNGCAKLTDSAEDDKKLKAFTFSLLLRNGVSLQFTPLVMKEHMVPTLGQPVTVATDSVILTNIQNEVKRQEMEAEDARWNAKAAEDTKNVQKKLGDEKKVADANEILMQNAEAKERADEHKNLKKELDKLLPSLAKKKKTFGGYRNQSLQPLKTLVDDLVKKLADNTLTDEERIDKLIAIRNEAETLKDRKPEAANVLKTVQSHLSNEYNLNTITRLEEAADRAEMEAAKQSLEYFESHDTEPKHDLLEAEIAEREKKRETLNQPYMKEATAVKKQAEDKIANMAEKSHYTSEAEFEKNKAILSEASSEIIAATLLRRVGMQAMPFEKGMNTPSRGNEDLTIEQVNQLDQKRTVSTEALKQARKAEEEKIWNEILAAKENQSADRKRQLNAMTPDEKEREIRMAEIKSYAAEIRTRKDFMQMMESVTDWNSLEAMKAKATGGQLMGELSKHAKLVTAEEKKRDLEIAAAKKLEAAEKAKNAQAAAPKKT